MAYSPDPLELLLITQAIRETGTPQCFARPAHRLAFKERFRFGSSTDLTAPKFDFRFPPESGLKSDIAPRLFRANMRHASFYDQDRTVRQLYNSIGSAADQPVVER
jgi:hypothetical protein